MFASLGFQVDTSGLDKFKVAVAEARKELTKMSLSARNSKTQFSGLRKEIDKLATSMTKIKGTAGSGKVTQAYKGMAGAAHRLNNAFNAIVNNRKAITNAIGKINSSVFAGLDHWQRYRTSVVQTRRALLNLNRDIARLRANSTVRVNVNHGGGGAGGGARGNAGGIAGMGAGFGMKAFLGNIVPSMALASVGGGAGYASVAAVQASREQTSMESMILMTSKSAGEFKSTIDYVNKEALRLGVNAADFGKSFAQISMSADTMTSSAKKEMFTGFSEFMMAMGTNADDQKGIFRAFNQMFSNNRILQEEINQLSDRGIPATLIYDAAMKAYGLDTVRQVKKLQEAGKLSPEKVLTLMSQMLQEKAHSTGAYDKMQQSSMFKQNQFMSEMRAFAHEIMSSGLDEALGDLFGLLTQVIQVAKEISFVMGEAYKGFKIAKDAVDEFTMGQSWLSIVLLVLIGRFGKIRFGLARTAAALRNGAHLTRGFSFLLTGIFGKALGSIVWRFGLWSAAIWAVSKAYGFLHGQIKESELGNWTFFDEMFLAAERLGARVQLLGSQIRTFFLNAAVIASTNPMNSIFGEYTQSSDFQPNTSGLEPERRTSIGEAALKYLTPYGVVKGISDIAKGLFSDSGDVTSKSLNSINSARDMQARSRGDLMGIANVDVYVDGQKSQSLQTELIYM